MFYVTAIKINACIVDRFPVSSIGYALVYWAGGRWFKPRPDQHSGSLNN